MNTHRLLSCAGGLFLLVALAGCTAGPEPLALRWTAPDETRRVHITSDLVLPIGIANADHKETELLLKYHAEKPDPNGLTLVEVAIAAVKASMLTLGDMSFHYDSETEPNQPPADPTRAARQQQFQRAFAGLKGSSFAALVDPRGRVLRLTRIDDPIKAACTQNQKDIGSDQAAMVLDPSQLSLYVALGMWDALGQKYPKPGDAWVGFEPVVAPRASPFMVQKSYTFKSVENRPDQKVALVSFQTADANELPPHLKPYAPPPGLPAPQGFEIISCVGEGEITYSLTAGHLLKLDEKTRLQIHPRSLDRSRNLKNENRPPRPIYYLVNKTMEFVAN